MIRIKAITQPCGCELHYERVARSMFICEFWGKFCPAHDIEEKAFREERRKDYEALKRERVLAEEFT